MAKKKSSLKNRLARFQAAGRLEVASFQLDTGGLSLADICCRLIRQVAPLEDEEAARLTECLQGEPTFTADRATGWVVGMLAADLAYGTSADNALMDDARLRAIEDDVIEALGPDAHWYATGDHPLSRFRPAGSGRGWMSLTPATYDLLLAARGNGFDLVLFRTQED
ncbi:hypothetical protein OHA44_37060 [Streptomyces sp. NBC_00144]|uniref:hypothetical protein n=1 Tax=Streptomyces sp. NBC_00144 TaxID=2975665 RepID=UPI00324325D2